MLVPAMNQREIINEIQKDYTKLYTTTIQRIGLEYDRERRKLKIEKSRRYPRLYTVKTATKNNWMLVFEKRPSVEKYTCCENIIVCPVVYYYDKVGLNVLHWSENTKIVQSHFGHVFDRYNQRMRLGLSSPIEIVKRYFNYNAHKHCKPVWKDEECYMMGFSRDGFLFGKMDEEYKWITWKTFVNRDLIRKDQSVIEIEEIGIFQKEIDEFLKDKEEVPENYQLRIDKLKGIQGNYRD